MEKHVKVQSQEGRTTYYEEFVAGDGRKVKKSDVLNHLQRALEKLPKKVQEHPHCKKAYDGIRKKVNSLQGEITGNGFGNNTFKEEFSVDNKTYRFDIEVSGKVTFQ